MAPLALTRSGGDAPQVRQRTPAAPNQEEEIGFGGPEPSVHPPEVIRQAPQKTPPATTRAPARNRGLSQAEIVQLMEGGVPTSRIADLVGERGISFVMAPAIASQLRAKGAPSELIEALNRARGQTVPAEPLTPTRRTSTGGAGTTAAVGRGQYGTPARTTPPTAGMRGPRYTKDQWGLSFVVPPNWKVGERQGILLLGSDTEAGLMIVRLARKTTLEQLSAEYGEGMQEEGLQLMPVGQPESFPAGANRGLAGEMAGVAQDGARIHARVVAVASPFGDAAVVMGMTTEEKYPQLKSRVESLAASLSFTQPKTPPVLEFLAGQYWYMSGSSFGSSERYLNLCGDGTFSQKSEIYSSGEAGTAAGGRVARAQWSAEGDEGHGFITVTYPNGETKQMQYWKAGTALNVDGTKYERYGDGSCSKRSPVYD